MKTILVTGATGFIGNYVVTQLLEKGYRVTATSSDPVKAQQMPWYAKVEYIPFNFDSFDNGTDYYNYFQRPDLLIHLAWPGLPNYKEAFHIEVNLPAQYAFLKNLFQNGLRNLTVTGTCFEYGMKEGALVETMPCEPANAYAIAKDELRKQLEVLAAEQGTIFKWVRLFYMYGRGQSPKSLISQLERALEAGENVFNMSGGEQVRDFLPVETVAEGITRIALQDTVTGIINCCSGQPVTVKDFVLAWLKEKGKTIRLNLGYYPYTDYEPMRFWGDNTKFKSIENNEQVSADR